MTIEKEAFFITRNFQGAQMDKFAVSCLHSVISKALQKKQDRIEEYKNVCEKLDSIQTRQRDRIEELESALMNCLSTLQLCYSKKDYMPFSIQYVTKSIELAKKAIGGTK